MPFEESRGAYLWSLRSGSCARRLQGWFFVALLFLALFQITGHSQKAQAQQPQSLPQSPLIIETAEGQHHFTVELANTDKERNTGLMYRKDMAADHGMLFDMGVPQQARFWMKNTYLPLDIIFIRSDGRISNIERGTPMQLTPPVLSRGRVLAVLELNAGTAHSLGIRPGNLVRHSMFGNWIQTDSASH